MFAYYLMVLVPFLGLLLDKKRRGIAFLSIFFIGLFLVLSFRSTNVGIDLSTYESMFNSFSKLDLPKILALDYETGYVLLNKVVAICGGDFQTLLVACAFLTTFPFWLLYKDEAENYPILIMALFLVVFPFAVIFSALRQAIAMGLVALSYLATKKHKLFTFIFTVLLAYTFHESAWVAFIIYPIYNIKVKPFWLWCIIPIMVIVFLLNDHIFEFILPLFNQKYEKYDTITNTTDYAMLLLFIVFLAFSFIVPDENILDDESKGLRSILLLVVFLQLFVPISFVAMRINYYFIPFVLLLIPKVMKSAKEKYVALMPLANFVMCAFFITYFFVIGHLGRATLNIVPYIPVWGN
jgi:hypothetical protein